MTRRPGVVSGGGEVFLEERGVVCDLEEVDDDGAACCGKEVVGEEGVGGAWGWCSSSGLSLSGGLLGFEGEAGGERRQEEVRCPVQDVWIEFGGELVRPGAVLVGAAAQG